jgi:hypothetical protein
MRGGGAHGVGRGLRVGDGMQRLGPRMHGTVAINGERPGIHHLGSTLARYGPRMPNLSHAGYDYCMYLVVPGG